MPTTIIDNIKGSEIPPSWLAKAKEKPDKIFTITIQVKQDPQQKVVPEEQPKQKKWLKVVEDFKKNPLTKEARKTLNQASDQFGFRI